MNTIIKFSLSGSRANFSCLAKPSRQNPVVGSINLRRYTSPRGVGKGWGRGGGWRVEERKSTVEWVEQTEERTRIDRGVLFLPGSSMGVLRIVLVCQHLTYPKTIK
jgi:hypothetical protein